MDDPYSVALGLEDPTDPFEFLTRRTAPEPTLGERAQQSASNLLGGFAETFASIPEYAGIIGAIDREDGEAYANAVRDFARSIVPPVENRRFGFIEDTLAQGLGSGISFLVPGAVGARVTQGAGLAARTFATYGIPAALGATAESTGQFYEALAHGASEDEAWQAFTLGHAVGASEAIPIGRLLARINKGSGGALQSILIEGIEEFAQESGQTVAGNLIAQNIYDEERELLEGMVENGSAGFLTGVILSAVTRRVPGLGPREGAEEAPVEDSPFPEGAESIGAQVDALNEGRIPAFLVTPGSAAPEGLGEDVQNREVEGGTLYTRDPAILERARMGEPMGDVLGYGISERPQGDDAQNVVVARDASGRIVRGVVSPAEVPPSVLEAQERAAGEGGTVETLGRDEALEALSERAGERAPRKLGSALQEQRIRQHFGPTATAVETRRGSEQDRISEFAAERGRNVVYVEAGEGTANIPGFIDEGGTIYLDANVDPDQGLWGVALHEMQHALKGPKGQSSVDWANEAKEIIEADREAFGRFVEGYRARYESATGQALPEALNEDEGVAFLTENLGDWLRFSIDNPGVLESVARGNRTLFERISDAIARVLESLGLNVQTSIQKRLAAIRSEVADTELTADLDPELLARWTTTIRTALDTTLGTDVEAIPLLQGPMQQQGPAREGEASPARGTGELPTAADLDPATMAAAAMPVGRKRTPGEVARANNAKRMGELAEGKHGLVPYVQSLGGLQWSPEAAAVAERAPGVQQGPGLHRLVQPEGSTKGVSLDTLTEQLIDDGIWFPGATTGDIRPADVLEAIEENLRPASGRDLDFDRFALAPPTDSPEFRRWFGNSAVVDESGAPLVVYHGTATPDITQFNDRPERRSSVMWLRERLGGAGLHFFASKPTVAQAYADERGAGGGVLPVYLAMQNPLVLNANGQPWHDMVSDVADGIERFVSMRHRRMRGVTEAAYRRFANEYDEVDWTAFQARYPRLAERMRRWGVTPLAEKPGESSLSHDGVVIRSVMDGPDAESMRDITDVYIAFRPEQIKSAIGNVGTFDPQNPDIRFAVPAWHGSGERFDKFTTDKIGTGEGAQAYGWGLYFADRREVAEHYRSFVGRESREVYIDGELAFSNADFSETPKNRAAYMIAVNDGVEGALRAHEQLQEQLGHPAHLEPVADAIRALEGRVEVKRKRPGATYAVTLAPDEDEYLLWDEPLAKQSAKVQAALADWRRFDPMRGQPFDEDTTGGELYRRLAGTEWVGEEQRDVSETLRAAGIRGIKYLDGASRGDGEGSYNYVIFDESDVQIDERFALPSGAKAVKATKQSIKRNLTAVGDLPVSAFNAAIDRDSSVKAETTHLRESVADFQRAMRTEYGKKPGAAAIRAVDQALHGSPGAIARLPERLRQPVNAMRMHVDSLSRRMIDDGVLEGVIRARFTDPKSEAADEAVAAAEEKVSDNLGVYLTRSYQVFDDPKWADKVPEEVKNKAKALLRSEYPKRTEEEIKGLLKNLLYVGKAADSPIAVLAQSKLGAKDLSILQRRKDIAPEIRALWGEYTDPRVNYARSVTKMAHLIANHQMLERVREEGTGTWLFENPTSNERGDFIKPIAAEGSAVMAPLNGLHTTPEIIRAFEEATNPEHIPRWLEKYLFANSWVKYAKTVASPMTNVRNLLGNIGFAVANGHWRAGKMADAGAAVWTDLRKKPVKERREYIRRAIEAGVLHESASAGELFDLLKESMGTGLDAMQDESVRGQLRRAMAFGAEVYQSQDDLWKLYAWENEIARYGEANPDMSRTELERHAAEIVRNTYPTYSLVPRAIRNLRRFPLVGTFVSFPWEVLRVTGNTMRLMQQEMRSSNPKVRQIGAQRLGGMVLASTLTGAIAKASQHLMGLSSEDDDDARLFLAPWDRNGDLVWIGGDEDGNRTFVNLSYVDPFSYLKEPIMAFMRGQSVDQAVLDAAGQLLEPFFGEEILAQSLIDVARNRRDTGQSIYTPEDPWPTILEDVATHVAQPFKPGAVTSAERIVKGLTGHVEPYGRSYDASVEALAVFTGNRLQSLDVPQALSFRGADYSRSQRRVTSGLSSVAGRRGEVSEDELREAYEEAENSRRTLFEEMHRTVRAAIALGVPEAEVLESLRGGMSGKEARALLHGDYRAYAPSGQFLASRARGADAETAAMYRDRRTFLKRLAAAREE